jgi:DNA-binding transcriptional ArsR family regulator
MALGMLALTPEALKEISRFFRLLAEPTRLQLLCQLRHGPMDTEGNGVRLLYDAEGEMVDDLCLLVQTRLRQRLEAQLQHLAVA